MKAQPPPRRYPPLVSSTLPSFSTIDCLVLLVYLAAMVVVGAVLSGDQENAERYFLGGHRMPVWAVALSVLATALSAATFVGAPALSFRGDLTYLVMNLGGFLAAILVATLFIPAFYRAGTLTIYGYLRQRYGPVAGVASSLMFILGRLLASGARLFMGGIAFSLILYHEVRTNQLIYAVVIFGGIGTLYTVCGGIRAVIWTDVIQIIVVVGAALMSIYLLLDAIPLTVPQIIEALHDNSTQGHSKIRIIDTSADLSRPFTLWTGLAIVFLNMASYGVDHDLAQRMLTCKTSWRGGLSLIISNVLGIPVVCLFLIIGLLLYVFYSRPDLMGAAAPTDMIANARQVYPQFLLNHLPAGLSGLAMVGLCAAAMSSFDSAVQAMAGSVVADLYLPWRRAKDRATHRQITPSATVRISRWVVAVMGLLLTLFAVTTALLQLNSRTTLIEFALGIMAFAYAGLLGVFLAARLTKRGNSTSVLLALLAGAIAVLIMQPYILPHVTQWLIGKKVELAFAWWMVVGTTLSFLLCIVGRADVNAPYYDVQPRSGGTTDL